MKAIHFVILLIAIASGVLTYFLVRPTPSEAPEELVGGERDEYGCLGPAGYAYDDEVGACIRAFEMTPDIKKAAALAVDSVGRGYALTVVSFNSFEEVGAYDIMLEVGLDRIDETVYIRNWKIVEDPSISRAFDARNATFVIDGKEVALQDGFAETPVAPGSASKNVVRYFGNEAYGDLNSDGLNDMAFLVTEDNGGSGTFFYAVAALQTENGYKTTNAFLVGDRIAPQSTVIPVNSGEIQVNYAERKEGEPMSASPTEGATLLLKVTPDGVLEGLMQ